MIGEFMRPSEQTVADAMRELSRQMLALHHRIVGDNIQRSRAVESQWRILDRMHRDYCRTTGCAPYHA